MDERRGGVGDRRVSNWHAATHPLPPSPDEALALALCVETIRTVLSKDDGMEMYPETLRTWVDSIALAVATLDQMLNG
jgi:hypothetical protein